MSRVAAVVLVVALAAPARADRKPGFTANVPVAAPTRIDWTFAVTNRTVADPPPTLLDPGYASAKQSFDLYLPPRPDAAKEVPAIVFVSAGNDAAGWKAFEPTCTKLGIAYVAVRGAGNNVPPPQRVRIVLDCLDELRRNVPVDPDRTYIAGFSGGGRMACAIGFALPEYFGGILPLCASGELREEPWLRHRAADRLSAALVTGPGDFNRGEVALWRGPFWRDLGIRTKVWEQPGLGHALPSAATLGQAVAWLEEDRPRRAALAKKHPATRADARTPAAAQPSLLLDEAKAKAADPKTAFAGLMLAKGVSARWPDRPEGKAARDWLVEYDARGNRAWEKDDIAEQRRTLVAEAKSLSDYALKGVPANSPYLKSRPDMARRAISLWEKVIDDSPGSADAATGKRLVPELEPLTKK